MPSLLAALIASAVPGSSFAGCSLPESDAAAFDESSSVIEAEVVSAEPYLAADQTVRTRYVLRTGEKFKGTVGDQVEITTPGGTLGDRTDFRSDSVRLRAGGRYLLMLDRKADGTLSVRPQRAFHVPQSGRETLDFFRVRARGRRPNLLAASAAEESTTGTAQGNSGVPGSVVTATGYSETVDGHPTRFVVCDGDEPIPYLVDVDPTKLPTGMTQAQAVSAVQEVMAVWAASSSLKFRYEGLQSFGVAASSVTTEDRKLRIQLHDNYNAISPSNTLGIGGGSFTVDASLFTGGKIGARGFQERRYGYVVLESTASSMLNTANFKQVLTHEVGHALGLEHSSNNTAEPNAVLKEATMYYASSNDGRGAAIKAYDQDRIAFGYPPGDTPPYCSDRIIPGITANNVANLPTGVLGVNRIQLRAFDRQGTALTAATVPALTTSSMSLSGSVVIYTPTAFLASARLTDAQIVAGTHYGRAVVQFSDGVNVSRPVNVTVIERIQDSTPSDGLSDSWMNTYFGTTAVGAIGTERHPDSDPDGDGLSNRVEFYLNTNPKDANSGAIKPVYNRAARTLTFTPVRFAPYRIEVSTNLVNWTSRSFSSTYTAPVPLTYDLSKPSPPAKEFYRVVTGP